MGQPLVDEVLKKASVAWVSVDERPATAVWCLAIDGALFVVSGPGEQSAPGLADAAAARVTMRGDHGGAVVSWAAEVSRLAPADEDWEAIATQLAGKRLNASGTTAAVVARWAASCVVNRLVPAASEEALTGTSLPSGSQAAPPRETPAARPARKPFRLHRVRKR